jgi:hypothetical protein
VTRAQREVGPDKTRAAGDKQSHEGSLKPETLKTKKT